MLQTGNAVNPLTAHSFGATCSFSSIGRPSWGWTRCAPTCGTGKATTRTVTRIKDELELQLARKLQSIVHQTSEI